MITGRTTVAAVIGHPVVHSLSPALHNAAFASLGIDWVYAAFDVAEGDADRALDAMQVLGLGGLSVTMPHKAQVASAVHRLDPAAAALRSVNTVVVEHDGTLSGYSTDGAGLIASLEECGHDVNGARACVLGAGGAGRAIVDALARAGASRIDVVNRTAAAADEAVALAGDRGSVASASAVADADLVINATSVGMHSTELPCDPALLRAGQVVVDIVYQPRRTALLDAAQTAGAATVDGLGMLVHQAVLQQRLWHGQVPDPAVMRAAAEAELSRRQ